LYFSGFCLKDEKNIFKNYLKKNDFTVSGFSYGTIKALEYTLNTSDRIDLLQLFSPSFFNDKDDKYKRLQLIFFQKDKLKYCDNFIKNCGLSDIQKDKYFQMGTKQQLKELLYYQWNKDKLTKIINKNINIEVYLGQDDKIINSQKTLDFFKIFGEVYFVKNKEHIL